MSKYLGLWAYRQRRNLQRDDPPELWAYRHRRNLSRYLADQEPPAPGPLTLLALRWPNLQSFKGGSVLLDLLLTAMRFTNQQSFGAAVMRSGLTAAKWANSQAFKTLSIPRSFAATLVTNQQSFSAVELRMAYAAAVFANAQSFKAAELSDSAVEEILALYQFGDGVADTVATGVTAGNVTNGSHGTFDLNSVPGYASDPVLRVIPPSGSSTLADAVSNNAYHTFTLTPGVGKKISLTNMTFNAAKGGSGGTRGYGVRSSIDSYSSDLSTADLTAVRTSWENIDVDLSGGSFQNLTAAITFRIYSYTANTSQSIEYDDLTVNGVVGNAS